jgi:hypothetical protein
MMVWVPPLEEMSNGIMMNYFSPKIISIGYYYFWYGEVWINSNKPWKVFPKKPRKNRRISLQVSNPNAPVLHVPATMFVH